MLTHSWRGTATTAEITPMELSEITPLLIRSGGGALAWWRIRNSGLVQIAPAAKLKETYWLHRLEFQVHAQKIREIIKFLRAADVEPVLVKGWNVARLYPEPGLRHYIDVDLCVAPEQFRTAERVLANLGADASYVDLHCGLGHLDDAKWKEVFARTQLVTLNTSAQSLRPRHLRAEQPGGSLTAQAQSTQSKRRELPRDNCNDLTVPIAPHSQEERVRVLCDEDHLRVLSVHWLRHGAWKAAGLCDIALMIENLPSSFDWNVCLGSDRTRAHWVAVAIGLAHELLGADVTNCEYREPPRWLVLAVLRQWARSDTSPAFDALCGKLRQPRQFLQELFARWDQPMRATVALHRRFNYWPRFPYQLLYLAARTRAELAKQLKRVIGRKYAPASETFSGQQPLISDI
jgi:hypothetical protein